MLEVVNSSDLVANLFRLITRNHAEILLSSLGPLHIVKNILRQVPPVQGKFHNPAVPTADRRIILLSY